MKRTIVIAFALFLSGCSAESSESYEARDARYQVAKKDCSMVGAKTALPGGGQAGSGADAVKAIEDCMSSKGFDVKMK